MRTRHLIACGLAALSLTAAGCGDDKEKEPAKASDGSVQTQTEEESGGATTTGGDAKQGTTSPPEGKPKVEVPSGPPPKELQIEDIVEGAGQTAKSGDQVTVNYVGVSYSTKKEFDTSFGRGPFPFPLGAGQVIPGWDEGVAGMKVGGRRKLIIPPDMAYGAAGAPPAIKPNETLVFVVDLISID